MWDLVLHFQAFFTKPKKSTLLKYFLNARKQFKIIPNI